MNAESKLLIDALRQSVAGTKENLSTEVDWQALMKLAKSHMLQPLLYDGLRRDEKTWAQVPEAVQKALHEAFFQAVYQDTHMNLLRNALEEKLSARQIPHIFLKGSVLKQNYPIPALRTMCDMDILVRTEDYDLIDGISPTLGGRKEHSDGNHRTYTFPANLAVEFHPNLLHQATPIAAGINPGWQYADPKAPNALTEEGFYLNTICHLAHHFVSGGVGVRFVLDIWVNRHLRQPAPDRAFVEAELERFRLLDFTRNMEALAEYWFGNGEGSPLLEELGEYILTSGSHGTLDREILNAMSLSSGSRFSALMKKVFYPRAELEDRFPWCKGKPLLLPAAWCARAYYAVTRHGDLILRWGNSTGNVTKEQASRQKEKLEKFGINKKK